MFAKKINRVVEKRNEESILKLCFQAMLRWMSLIGLYSEKQHPDGIGHIIRRWIRLDHLRSFYRYFVLFYFETTTSFEMQVFRMNPQIEAAGIFTVSNKRLFLSVCTGCIIISLFN